MTFKRKVALRILGVLVMAIVLGGVVMLLWNAVMPTVVPGLHAIDYPRAFGLLILCRLLVGGMPGRGGGWRGRRHWARWEAMTAEERERFREQVSGGRGCAGRPR